MEEQILPTLGSQFFTSKVRASQLAKTLEGVVLQYQLYNRVATLLTFRPDALVFFRVKVSLHISGIL